MFGGEVVNLVAAVRLLLMGADMEGIVVLTILALTVPPGFGPLELGRLEGSRPDLSGVVEGLWSELPGVGGELSAGRRWLERVIGPLGGVLGWPELPVLLYMVEDIGRL